MYTHDANARAAVLNGAAQGVTLAVTLANAQTLSITEANIVSDTFYIDRASSSYGNIPMGTATSNECGFTLNNVLGTYNGIDFGGAKFTVQFYYYNDSGTRTYLCDGGIYYVIDAPVTAKQISVVSYGELSQYDVIDNNAGQDIGNIRTYAIFRLAAQQVTGDPAKIDYSSVSTLANKWLYNYRYPAGTDVTLRNMIGWTAMMCGAMAREHGNSRGIQIVRYENTGLTIDKSNSFEGATWDNTVQPTGLVGYDASGTEYSAGTAGYEIEIRSNGAYQQAYNQSDGTKYHQRIVNDVWSAISSITYTSMKTTCVPMPWLECGDMVTFTDENNVNHSVILTRIRYYLNGRTSVESNVASPETNTLKTVLPSSIKRSSIETSMLRLNALKSINYVDLAGNFSTAGTFFDLANGVIKSKNFAITSVGDAIFKGIIQAYSGGKIGDLNIAVDSQTGETGLSYINGDVHLQIYPREIRIAYGDNAFDIYTHDGSLNINADIFDYDNDIETKLIIDNERFSVKFIDGDFTVHSGIEMTEAGGNLIGTWKHNGSPI